MAWKVPSVLFRLLILVASKFSWRKEQKEPFEALKEALSCEPVLACFHFKLYLITDASPVGLGAILLQDQNNGERKPIAYISRSLTPTERRYSQIEREALGCVWAVERLHNYLFGINFTLLTDNKPLIGKGQHCRFTLSTSFEMRKLQE